MMKHLLYNYYKYITNRLNISIPKCHLPSQNVHCRQLAGSPTRARTAMWPRALLTFPPRDREELDNKKITCEIRCGKPARTGSLRKVLKSGKSLRIWLFSKTQGKLWYSTTRKKVRYIQPLFNNNKQYWGFRSSALARKRLYKCEIPGKPGSKNGFKNRILSCSHRNSKHPSPFTIGVWPILK